MKNNKRLELQFELMINNKMYENKIIDENTFLIVNDNLIKKINKMEII